MKSAVQTEFARMDSLRIVEREKPAPGPGAVLLRMTAASLNHRDLTYLRNDYPGYGTETFLKPVVPLSDGVGFVEAVGSNRGSLAIGDRVCTLFNQAWLSGEIRPEYMIDGLMPGPRYEGVLQEYVCLDHSGVVKPPAHLTDAEASTLPCSGLTAWSALRRAGLKAGETVLISGTGGVAIAALQFAKAIGARVILTSSSDWKRQKAMEIGADAVLPSDDLDGLVEGVRAFTDGNGADVSVEAGGGRTLNASLECLALEGRMALMGLLSGAMPEVDLPLITVARRSIIGVNVGNRDDFIKMCAFIEATGIRPYVDRVFPMGDFAEAFDQYEKKALISKFVISIPA